MEFRSTPDPVPYEDALAFMEQRVAAIRNGEADDLLWFLEHPPLYTAGTSAQKSDLIEARFPVFETGRGGQYTYHGPGQRIAYAMVDLRKRQKEPDIKHYVRQLEQAVIDVLDGFGIRGERREGRVGIWVQADGTEKKIAAIGVRVRHWVTYHGLSFNLNPDLSHFSGIVPCGIRDYGVTSLSDLGCDVDMATLDDSLKRSIERLFPDDALRACA